MSGICGALALGGGLADDLSPALDRMAARAPDGSRQWRAGPVALGFALLATTPEALVERLPLVDEATGCAITADARIDNRVELITALGVAEPIGDGELILRAYLTWGEACPTHLIGDFAFAIWDPRARHLFAARDHMGMRQFIYHHRAEGIFAFATDAEALAALPAVPARIDPRRIADFLVDLEAIDLTSTFFENIVRLPPAHRLTVSAQGLSVRPYWRLEGVPERCLAGDDAYAAAFRDIFTEAVRCRLRGAGPIGSMLSGGIDSGSVAAVASTLLAAEGKPPLPVFSAVGPDRERCRETRTIHAAGTLPHIDQHLVDHSMLGPIEADLLGLADHGEPFDAHMVLIRALYLKARDAGVKVVLDGVGGDVILTAGNAVATLLRRGRFGAALREARTEPAFWGGRWSPWRTMARAAWVAFMPAPIRNLRRRWLGAGDMPSAATIDPAFAAAVDLPGRINRHHANLSSEPQINAHGRARAIVHPNLVVGRERYDRVAASCGIEPRDPFLDIRLVEFCLSLPADQLQRDGWPKWVLRRAMVGLLPDEVIWRRGKEHLGWDFITTLLDRTSVGSDLTADDRRVLAAYLVPNAIEPIAFDRLKPAAQRDRVRHLSLLRSLRRIKQDLWP